MIRSNEIKPDVYAEARRQVDPVRREIKKVFLNMDIVITPTMKTPPGTITAALNPPAPPPPNPATTGNATRNAGGAGLNSVGAFDVYGLPCGIQTAPNSPYVYSVKGALPQRRNWLRKRRFASGRALGCGRGAD
jgi:Asp-tRNA(Asn)/Glu-tRNA(Gln) amidotransferase A subunit family amidase